MGDVPRLGVRNALIKFYKGIKGEELSCPLHISSRGIEEMSPNGPLSLEDDTLLKNCVSPGSDLSLCMETDLTPE